MHQPGRGGAKAQGIKLNQTYAKEGQLLGYKAGGYAHARQYKRMRKVIQRQRTIVGRLQREVSRKMSALGLAVQETSASKASSTTGTRQKSNASPRVKAAPRTSSV